MTSGYKRKYSGLKKSYLPSFKKVSRVNRGGKYGNVPAVKVTKSDRPPSTTTILRTTERYNTNTTFDTNPPAAPQTTVQAVGVRLDQFKNGEFYRGLYQEYRIKRILYTIVGPSVWIDQSWPCILRVGSIMAPNTASTADIVNQAGDVTKMNLFNGQPMKFNVKNPVVMSRSADSTVDAEVTASPWISTNDGSTNHLGAKIIVDNTVTSIKWNLIKEIEVEFRGLR